MANPRLFQPKSKKLPAADTVNAAGGVAYSVSNEVALAQMACTSFLADQYYTDAKDQLDEILQLCKQVPAEWIAKVAVYARKFSFMKDTPALLVSYLAVNEPALATKVFPAVIHNGRMIRNVVQILRSGRIDGKHTLPHCVRTAIANWLNTAKVKTVFEATVGNDPSLADIIKMVHPKPVSAERQALFGHIIGRPAIEGDNEGKANYMAEAVPQVVREYEAFKAYMKAMKENSSMAADSVPSRVPDLPFQMLDSLGLTEREWREIAINRDRFLFTLKNLNTFERQGVFKDERALDAVRARLSSKSKVQQAMVFPFQILAAYRAVQPGRSQFRQVGQMFKLDPSLVGALHTALENAIANVPVFEGSVAICVDVSGSMSCPITGRRGPESSAVRRVDVAGLFAASVFRKNQRARIYPFSNGIIQMQIDPFDQALKMADTLGSYNGGATDWDAPLRMMHHQKFYPDLCIYFSDMQGWVSAPVRGDHGPATSAQKYWQMLRQKNPKARLIMVNLEASTTVQVQESQRAMLVGGFTDEVFRVADQFHRGELDNSRWTGRIDEAVNLENL